MLDKLKSYDYLLSVTVIAMSVFGIFMVYAGTHAPGTPFRYAGLYEDQILFVASGAVLMIVVSFIDYHFIGRFYILIYAVCLALLVLVRFLGDFNSTGASGFDRWIIIPIPGLGQSVSIQPSEFTKIFMIITLAKFIDKHKDSFNHILMLLVILVGVAVPVVLIYLQPSLSASVVVLLVSLLVVFTGGLYYRTIFIALLIAVPLVIFGWMDMQRENPIIIDKILTADQMERLETFQNPEPGSNEMLQLEGSLYSIGSGGMYGKGFGNNTYIIYGYNDFVFSTAAEQFGFVGSMCILGVMAFIIVRCVLIALRAYDLQGRLIAAGVAGMLLIETFVHVGIGTGLLPVTGIVFPFLSAGGSITWVHMAAVGFVLNVAQPREKGMFD
jgi:rod shape determining protein RodA